MKPNVVIMLMDNLGYGDLGCYGSELHDTPNVDQLAEEGMRLTDFYSASGVCTPSRAALMTGCYPRRNNMHCSGDGRAVLFPADEKGLHTDEITLADILKGQGYSTACVGKWHLGDQDPFLPTKHGFDEFFGCPYSEDMRPDVKGPHVPPLPLMRDEDVVEEAPDINYLTKRYTEEAIRFIQENQDHSFFLYVPYAMPGSDATPFASPEFRGQSDNGIYGDCVEELDWSAGRIMQTLADLGLDEDTIVIWTSDNGAVEHHPPQGSNAPLKGWGYDTSEGGQRMPCIVRWSGNIPSGVVSNEVVTMMDILPTISAIAGAAPPSDRIIDGYDVGDLLSGDANAVSPYDSSGFFYYHIGQLQAVRQDQWKLYLPLDNKITHLRANYDDGEQVDAELYNLRKDIREEHDVAEEHPEVVHRLMSLADAIRDDIGDWDREGRNQRPAGYVSNPEPQTLSP
ncbi:MAG: sulfatase [Candidatus Brocadiia bacterium]